MLQEPREHSNINFEMKAKQCDMRYFESAQWALSRIK